MKSKFIKDVLTSEVISVSPETNSTEIISTMRTKKISCIVITQNKIPVGIFTERDIVKAAYKGLHLKEIKIDKLMTKPVFTISDNTDVYEIYNLLITNNIRHLVVVNETGHLVGVVTQSDIITNLGLEYFFEVKSISEVMTNKIETMKKDNLFRDMVSSMAENSFSCMIVVDNNNKPVGIFTERDVVRLLDEGTDLLKSDITIEKIMSSPVITVKKSISIYDAVKIMNSKDIRRLIVVDKQKRIIGLITQFDIVKGLEAKYIHFLKQIIKKKEQLITETGNELIEKTAYLENIIRSSADMAIIATDIDLTILYFNSVAERIYGYKADDIINKNIKELRSDSEKNLDPTRFYRAKQIIDVKCEYSFLSEQKKEDTIRYIESSISGIWDIKERLIGYVLISRDITDRRLAEQRLHHMAHFDLLTDIPNRALFLERLTQALTLERRRNHMVGILFIDIDGFKHINDSKGHHVGDHLLKEISKRLIKCVRKSDTVARISGDEFAIILSSINHKKDATVVAQKMIDMFSVPFVIDAHECSVTGSIGISLQYPGEDISEETLLKNADTAMYRVKEQGKNNYQFYEGIK